FFRLGVEREFESLVEEIAQHRHLLIEIWTCLARGGRENIVAFEVDPIGSTGNGTRRKVVCSGDKKPQRVTFGKKLMSALHPHVPAAFVRRSRLDGRYFKFKCPCRRRLREHWDGSSY